MSWFNVLDQQDLDDHIAAADPHVVYQRESEKDAASGYPGLDGSSKLTGSQQKYGIVANTACEGNDARLVPTGMIMACARASPGSPNLPTFPSSGWLNCDGAAVSRTTYADLFGVIGACYGAGNGTTTFNVPDLQGKFLRGLDLANNLEGPGDAGGSQTPSITVNDPGHAHTIGQGTKFNGAVACDVSGGNTGVSVTSVTASMTDARPPFMTLNYMIKI